MRREAATAMLVFAALSAGACGNVSNEDLLFVAALPDQALRMDPPRDSGTATQGLGEWRPATELALVAAAKINVFTDSVLDHVSDISGRRPTSRRAGMRVWGPAKVRKTGLTARMTMERASDVACDVASAPLEVDAPGYRWTIELNRASTGDYVGFISGSTRGFDFSHSCGTLAVDVRAAKALGLRLDDIRLKSIEQIQIDWQRDGEAATIAASVGQSSTEEEELVGGLTYRFERRADRSGAFSFALFDDVRGRSTERFQSALQWKPRGRPWRADYCVTPNGATSSECGTSCGTSPIRATYRADGSGPLFGNAADCGGLTYEDPVASMN